MLEFSFDVALHRLPGTVHSIDSDKDGYLLPIVQEISQMIRYHLCW